MRRTWEIVDGSETRQSCERSGSKDVRLMKNRQRGISHWITVKPEPASEISRNCCCLHPTDASALTGGQQSRPLAE